MRLPRCETTITVINAIDWLPARYVPTAIVSSERGFAVRCNLTVAPLSFEKSMGSCWIAYRALNGPGLRFSAKARAASLKSSLR
jgi:hypothetical protein